MKNKLFLATMMVAFLLFSASAFSLEVFSDEYNRSNAQDYLRHYYTSGSPSIIDDSGNNLLQVYQGGSTSASNVVQYKLWQPLRFDRDWNMSFWASFKGGMMPDKNSGGYVVLGTASGWSPDGIGIHYYNNYGSGVGYCQLWLPDIAGGCGGSCGGKDIEVYREINTTITYVYQSSNTTLFVYQFCHKDNSTITTGINVTNYFNITAEGWAEVMTIGAYSWSNVGQPSFSETVRVDNVSVNVNDSQVWITKNENSSAYHDYTDYSKASVQDVEYDGECDGYRSNANSWVTWSQNQSCSAGVTNHYEAYTNRSTGEMIYPEDSTTGCGNVNGTIIDNTYSYYQPNDTNTGLEIGIMAGATDYEARIDRVYFSRYCYLDGYNFQPPVTTTTTTSSTTTSSTTSSTTTSSTTSSTTTIPATTTTIPSSTTTIMPLKTYANMQTCAIIPYPKTAGFFSLFMVLLIALANFLICIPVLLALIVFFGAIYLRHKFKK